MSAIRAVYIDKTYMKTSGAVRFVFEVPKEEAEQAEAIMGLPDPATSKWYGMARIENETRKTPMEFATELTEEV